jgi:site-specific recombinase XerD
MTQSPVMATPYDMIAAHLTWMRAGGYARNTVEDAGKLLHRVHREFPSGLHGAERDDLAGFLATDGWSDQTVACYYRHLIRFYRWAADPDDPWLTYDPTVRLRRPTAQPGLPRPALDVIVYTCLFETVMPWMLACRLAALAGLRPCEIAVLTRADVTERVITVKGKGGKTRAVPTVATVWELVEPLPAGPLMWRPNGQAVTADWVSMEAGRYLRKTGIPTTLYPLRHWYGTTVQRKYKDIRVTQELMGHASLMTTQGYTQVTSARMREAVDCLPFSGGTSGLAGASSAAVPAPRVQPAGADQPAGGRSRRPQSGPLSRP